MKQIIMLLLMLSPTSVMAQVDSSLIINWKSYPVPSNPDTLLKYNRAPNWRATIDHGSVKAIKGSYTLDLPFRISVNYETRVKFSGTRYAFKVDDGYLLTFNRGEFGGSLFWFSEDGSHHYEISGLPLRQVINRNGKLYGIEGLAHMNLSYGSMVEVLKVNQKWITKSYLKLPSAPQALQLDSEGNFIIVTSDDLISVDFDRNIKTLVSKGMWYPYLYPSSLVIDEHIVYIGMRQGVYKYNLVTNKAEWLMLR